MPIVEISLDKLDVNEIIRLAGGGDIDQNPAIRKSLEWAILESTALIDGKGIYRIFPASDNSDHISITPNPGETITFPFPGTSPTTGVEAVVVFVTTISSALEKEVKRQFNQGNQLEALFLDSAGSTAAEGVAAQLAQIVERENEGNNWRTGYRFSPGYCTWDMEIQWDIFRMLPAGDIGVELTESLLMLPRKSISGAIFFGKTLDPLNPCLTCKQRGCKDRRS